MINESFLRINLDNFHPYFDNIGKIVDFFDKKLINDSLNCFIQNHKLVISNNEPFINRIEIDHKGIFISFNKNSNLDNQVNYFLQIVNGVFFTLNYTPTLINRIGHAIHYVITSDFTTILRKMFTTHTATIANINELVFDLKINDSTVVRKIISTPVDTVGRQVLFINADYYTAKNIEFDHLQKFIHESADYFSNEEKILSGLYE